MKKNTPIARAANKLFCGSVRRGWMYFSTSLPPFTTRAPAAFSSVLPLEEYEYILHCEAGSTPRLQTHFGEEKSLCSQIESEFARGRGIAAVVINSQLFY
jgi:hypothetical protein